MAWWSQVYLLWIKGCEEERNLQGLLPQIPVQGLLRVLQRRSGTVFQGSGLQLREWVYIIREFQKNWSVLTISEDLGRNMRTVDSAVKKVMHSILSRRLIEMLGGEVEMDEIYIAQGKKRQDTPTGGRGSVV
ncbi:MAG: hypothetical protein ACE5I5_15815 [Candidatus Heimdallarchaeota archaeon]